MFNPKEILDLFLSQHEGGTAEIYIALFTKYTLIHALPGVQSLLDIR